MRLQEDVHQDESLLNDPHGFYQDENGCFFVNDYRNHRVAVFDHEGRFLSGIGREGDGPGEFRRIGALNVHDGILQIFDPSLRRLTRFRTDGILIDTHTLADLQRDLRITFLQSAYLFPDGRLALTTQEDIPNEEFQISRNRLLLLGPGRELLWEAITPEYRLVAVKTYQGIPGMGVPLVSPALASVMFDRGQGFLLFPGDAPNLKRFDLQGQLLLEVRMEVPPQPFTAQDRNRVLEEYDQRIAEASDQQKDLLKFTRDELVFPESWPWWTNARLDDAGFIWLRVARYTADPEAAGGGWRYQLLSLEGEFLGGARLPPIAFTNISQGNLLGMLTEPETGEIHLIVYRIVPAVSGLTYP